MFSSSQRKLPPFPSVQTPPSPSISSSYYIPPSTFPGHELPIPFPSTHLNNNTSPLTNVSLLQTQETFAGPGQYYPVKDNLFMFASEASCSSSDGSGSQISFGRDIKQEEMGNFQSYIPTGFEENHKFMMGYGGSNGGHDHNVNHWPEKPNGCFGGSPLDQYNLDQEDVKQQLISCSNGCTSSFFIDENKTQGKVMYYYWNWLKVASERFEGVWWEEIQIRLQFLGLCVCWNETLLFLTVHGLAFYFVHFFLGSDVVVCPYSSLSELHNPQSQNKCPWKLDCKLSSFKNLMPTLNPPKHFTASISLIFYFSLLFSTFYFYTFSSYFDFLTTDTPLMAFYTQ